MITRDLDKISAQYDTPFYVFYVDEFKRNYNELRESYKSVYDKFEIAYSFKTNYMPAACETVLGMGGFAEVVSDTEYKMAKRYGFEASRTIVNGPGKWFGIEEMVSDGAILMADNKYELDKIIECAAKADREVKIGFRMNFSIGTDKISRFGFDPEDPETEKVINAAREAKNICIIGLHYHLGGSRSVDAWKMRAVKMIEYSERLLKPEERKIIDLGSGMFGHVDPILAEQFGQYIPSFKEYADVVAGEFAKHYEGVREEDRPLLIVEPGSTVIANTMVYATRVIAIKNIRGRSIAMVDGSVHQLGELGKKKQLPACVLHEGTGEESITDADITGYTCLQDDIMYRSFPEELKCGDVFVIGNAGAYTNVMKPPFIQTGCKILVCNDNGEIKTAKRDETVDDFLSTYEEGIW